MNINKELITNIKLDNLKAVKFILEKCKYTLVNYALRYASLYGQFNIVKFLIENGANVKTNNNQPIQSASTGGYLDVVRLLFENGADIHIDNDKPLQYASYNGHIELVKFLVENGSNIHAEDNIIIETAKKHKQTDIINYFDTIIKSKKTKEIYNSYPSEYKIMRRNKKIKC
jgi:ankyrin repeat protein